MKHNAFTALSLAAALVVAGSAQATEFSMNFESGTTLPGTQGTWTVPSGDASAVVATPTGAPDACETQVLSLDTGDGELNYAPTSQNVTILEMDVCFVGADSVPDTQNFDGQTMLYLDISGETPAVKAYTRAEGDWVTLTGSVADGSWHTVRMEFSASSVAFFLDGNSTAAGTAALSNFTKVTSVGFKGTGMVDNFVGDKAPEVYWTDGETTNTMSITVSGTGTVSTKFPANNNNEAIQFVRVFSGDKYVTLRCPGTSSQSIPLPSGFGAPTKVMAFYGEEVTATDGIHPAAESVAVANGTVTVSFAAKSGVYYWLKDVSDGVSGNISLDGTATAIAPNAEREITLSFDADPLAWGVKKFKLVVSDEPPPAPSASGN